MTIYDKQQLSTSPFMQPQKLDMSDDDESSPPQLRMKRKIDEISQGSLGFTKKRQKTTHDYVLKRIDAPQVMTRDDAFQLGLRHTSTKIQKIVDKLSKEEREDLGITKRDLEVELTRTETMLSDEECSHIETVGKTYSQTLSSQLLELTAICKQTKKTHPEEGERILSFANSIIETLPKQVDKKSQTITDETPEEFLTIAKSYFEKISSAMGIIIPETAVKEYAAKLYEVSQHTEEELDQEKDDYEENTEKEAGISRVLSNLLFLADNDLSIAASCLKSPDLEVCREALINRSHKQMEGVRERIDNYETLLKHTAVHDIGQSLNHYTCIEIAKHLLLSNGSFNIAFVDDVIDALIPETLESTEAIKTSYYLLGNLAASPLGAMKIYKAKVPKDKNVPSNDLVRATMCIDRNTPISARDVQVTILSGLIENVRQAKVGSCFATAWLITLLHKHIDMVVEDFTDCIYEGKLTRRIDHETKKLPFQLRTSREGLDITLTIDTRGYLIRKQSYDKNPDEMKKEPKPTGKAYIWEVPGIVAACRALGYNNARGIVSRGLREINSLTFTPKQLLAIIAKYSHEEDKRTSHYTRTTKKLDLEEHVNIAQYAFGVQTRHALHSAWEQMAASSVSYLCSQFAMSLWVYDSLKDSLTPRPPAQTDHRSFHRYKNKLMDEILLPMISRMRYRYNHYIEDDKRFFEGNKGVHGIGFYGYELCDTGLPEDFEYSAEIAKTLKKESSHLFYKSFQEYLPEHDWKKVGKDGFQAFIQDVIRQTVTHLQSQEKGANRKHAIDMWEKVAEQFCKQVGSHTFLTKVTENLFGAHYRNAQRKEFKINEFTCQSTPWQLRWGGSPTEVIKSLYGYKKDLVGMYKYTGSAPSVLAWRINYCRRQPDFIKEQFSNPYYTTVVVNPPHAYVFRPGLKRFQEAINSNIPAPKWIHSNIVQPGEDIANKRLKIRTRNTLIEYIADNQWIKPCYQKQDLQRQELTRLSKKKFDEILSSTPNLYSGTVEEFRNKIVRAVVLARAADPVVGKRNHIWEQRFATALRNKILAVVDWGDPITKETASAIIDFARNRRDIVELSTAGREKFIQLMAEAPYGLSVQEFRKTLVDHITAIRKEGMGISKVDSEWIEKITQHLDNKIFELLPEKEREALIASGLVTDDPNWCDGVHSLFFMWVVNPGTGKLELCRYNKDLQNVEFMHQGIWFPKKKGYYWSLPKNYVTFHGAPTFNVKKFTGI